EELRRRILDPAGVREKKDAEIHEDAFFVDRTMFMHIHGHTHCDIRLAQSRPGTSAGRRQSAKTVWATWNGLSRSSSQPKVWMLCRRNRKRTSAWRSRTFSLSTSSVIRRA